MSHVSCDFLFVSSIVAGAIIAAISCPSIHFFSFVLCSHFFDSIRKLLLYFTFVLPLRDTTHSDFLLHTRTKQFPLVCSRLNFSHFSCKHVYVYLHCDAHAFAQCPSSNSNYRLKIQLLCPVHIWQKFHL